MGCLLRRCTCPPSLCRCDATCTSWHACCSRLRGCAEQEVRIGLPLPARQSACGQPKPLRLSYQHNDVRHGVDGPLHRDVYASVAGLHDAMQAQAAARGLDLQLVDDDECLVIRKWQADLVADDQLLNGSACSAVTA